MADKNKDKPAAYFIDGKRLSKLDRPRLVALCKRLHRNIELSERFRKENLDMALGALEKCDEQAGIVKELRATIETMTVHRDDLQAQTDDLFRKLTTSETGLSKSQAREAERDATIAAIRADVTVMRRNYLIARLVGLICAAGFIIAGASWLP